MTDPILEMHALAKGLVQGVGFRYTVNKFAQQLNLTGTVCNLSDGSVKIVAQGSEEALNTLVAKLKQESYPAKVNAISVDFVPLKHLHEEFNIVKDF